MNDFTAHIPTRDVKSYGTCDNFRSPFSNSDNYVIEEYLSELIFLDASLP